MREPDLTGVARAWRIRINEALKRRHRDEWGYDDAGIAVWFVNGPYHPVWSWWMVQVIHLRPIEGAPPAHRKYPEAEYEFGIYSLDPAMEPDIDALERGDPKPCFRFLTPPDAIVQFHGITDDQALGVGEAAIQAIVAGASPDSDFRSWWERYIAGTVEHYRAVLH